VSESKYRCNGVRKHDAAKSLIKETGAKNTRQRVSTWSQ